MRIATFRLTVALDSHPFVLQALIRRALRLQRERSAECAIAHHLFRQIVHRALGLFVLLQMQEHLLQGGHRDAVAVNAEPARPGLNLMLDGGKQGCEALHGIVR